MYAARVWFGPKLLLTAVERVALSGAANLSWAANLSGAAGAEAIGEVLAAGGLPELETLSLARNYLRGRTDALDSAVNLKTLLLSSNYLRSSRPLVCLSSGYAVATQWR